MNYASKTGLAIRYYAYAGPSGQQRNLYLSLKDRFLGQASSMEPLVTLRKLVVQARDKLISLGANKAG